MAPNLPSSSKRKSGPDPFSAARKRAKTFDARTLAVQSSDAALSKTGELDVFAFVAAREFEIRALEDGMRSSKASMAWRAFQKVPRNLRRRTASHNVKRVPKRLKARAKREMIENGTPTVTARRRKPTELLRLRLETARRLQGLNVRSKAKRAASKAKSKLSGPGVDAQHDVNIAPRVPKIKKNKLSHPSKPESKFKKRQRGKVWLPTHMFHAKRAHMTGPNEPLWRFAIPLTTTEKSYRPTHRASGARGAVAWDMSYISTIGLEGVEASLECLLRALGVDSEEAWGSKGKRWRNGTRSLEHWMYERDGSKHPIAPVTLVWCARAKQEDVEMTDVGSASAKKKPKRRLFLRVHPSAFLQLWNELLKVSKIQKPQVMVEDLRFEIGSIDITGPGSTEALMSTLKPVITERPSDSPEAIWSSLAGVTNAASLPRNALLGFNVSDPRLHYPPQTVNPPNSESGYNDLAVLLASWKPDSTQLQPDLFSRPARLSASRLLASQKAINRRRALAPAGEHPSPKPTDPAIPVLILTSHPRMLAKSGNSQGTWSVLLPWKCVLPIWYFIMHYPLSSGGNPRFGGLQEKQQLSFEAGEPWFPGDFPGTKSGWTWEMRQRKIQKDTWDRKPKGKRIEYDSVDLGDGKRGEIGYGWACHWERLVQGPPDKKNETNIVEPQSKDIVGGPVSRIDDPTTTDKTPTDATLLPPLGIHHLHPTIASAIFARRSKSWSLPLPMQTLLSNPALATVKITILKRGTPAPQARIYRLPSSSNSLRAQWLSLLNASASSSSKQTPSRGRKAGNNTSSLTTDKAGVSSLRDKINSNQDHRSYPLLFPNPKNDTNTPPLPLPSEGDLIGFVTTGNYNLSTGKGTGIGAVLVDKIGVYIPSATTDVGGDVVIDPSVGGGKERVMRTCIVRAAGESLGRLAIWEAV